MKLLSGLGTRSKRGAEAIGSFASQAKGAAMKGVDVTQGFASGMTFKTAGATSPLVTVPAFYFGGQMVLEGGAHVGGAASELFLRDRKGALDAQYEYEVESLLNEIAQYQERRAVEKTIATNTYRLARDNPQLYQEVLVARRLPRGAVVLGGKPRTDLLQELALRMGQGAYDQPDYNSLLGMIQQ